MSTDRVLPEEENRQTSELRTPYDIVGHVLFERFLIERDLSHPAAAGNCAIYLAKDLKHFCRKVVIKVLSEPLAERSGPPNSFHEVCEALMRLDHPNLEWILETGKLFDGRPYVVTTYTSGQSLEQILIGDRRLVLGRVAHIVESVAEGLAAAHARGILHGDITPASIVITPQEYEAENVRLTGFGSDSSFSRFTNSDLECEPFFYTAPELMFEDGRGTPASDIYSLAAVAYRMLTGDVPFEATDREAMLDSIVRGIRTRPSILRTDLPTDAEAILLSALRYKAVVRPRDVRAFGLELANELRECGRYRTASKRPKVVIPAIVIADTTSDIEVENGPDEVARAPRRFTHTATAIVSDKAIAWSLIILLLAGALSIPIGQTILENGQKPSAVSSIIKKPTDTRLPREIKYSFEGTGIKKDGSAGSQPISQNSFISSSGEYRMIFEVDSTGHAYVLSEAADEQGRTIYNLLYPQSKLNGGSAAIEPKQQVKTRSGTVTETRGTEIVWLVWTVAKQDDLESARRSALEADGIVRDESDVQKVKHFLERNKNNKLDIRQNDANQQTVVNGSGDRIVYRIELERR